MTLEPTKVISQSNLSREWRIEAKRSNTTSLYILLNAKIFFLCVCIIKLLCHFLPDLAQILNKAMNSKGAASKPVPGADFTQLLILRHLFVSHTQILADSQSNCEKVVEPKRNPNRTDFFGIQFSVIDGEAKRATRPRKLIFEKHKKSLIKTPWQICWQNVTWIRLKIEWKWFLYAEKENTLKVETNYKPK